MSKETEALKAAVQRQKQAIDAMKQVAQRIANDKAANPKPPQR